MKLTPAKSILPVAAFIWLISPSFYWLWQEASPVETTLLPALSLGQRILLAPHLILEQLGYWLWPMAREPLTFTVAPGAVMREGLFYWLILVLFIRFAWRLKKIEPWIFYGVVISFVEMIPFSGIAQGLVTPFDHFPLLLGGTGLATTIAALFVRGVTFWRDTERGRQAMIRRHGWRATSVLGIGWVGLMSVNLFAIMGRSWEQRIEAQKTDTPEIIVATEIARQYGADGQAAEAESLIIRCGQAAPWYAEISVVKAELLLRQGLPDAARVHLEKALELAPNHQHAKELLKGLPKPAATPQP